jgi:hypothetical protein
MNVRRCAATEVAAAFDELHTITRFGESAGGAHAGDTAADDGYGAGGELWRRLHISQG